MNCVRAQAKNLNHFSIILFVFIILNTLSAFAGPANTTYQAKIIKPDGLPLEASSVNFKFTILNPAGTCILYAETYSAVNMSGAGGLISFALGSGVKTYPVSATTFEQVFSNVTPSLSCDAGGPPAYSPLAADARKIVMQFHDGSGWQTLPAMNVNAVPYAMYANEAQKISGLPTCNPGEALSYNGVTFTCETISGVTSSTITTALGYTPADNADIVNMTSNVSSVSTTVFSVSSTVAGLTNSVSTLANTVAASFSAITSSQWLSSGTTINYSSGNVGIGTAAPMAKLHLADNIATIIILDGSLNSTGAPGYATRKSRGTIASPTAVLQNDYIGTFGARGYGTTGYSASTKGLIGIRTTENWTDLAQGTAIVFETTAVSSTTRLEQMRIDGAGNVGIGLSSPEAKLHIAAGTSATTAFKLTSGTLLTTPTSGAVEYDGFNLYYTDGTNTRRTLATDASAVTSSAITSALGYTPANSSVVASLAATVSGIAATQWATSGTTINYANNVGIGTVNPTSALQVSGTAQISGQMLLGKNPATGGFFNFGPLLGDNVAYSGPFFLQETITDLSAAHTIGHGVSIKLNGSANSTGLVFNGLNFLQVQSGSTVNYGSLFGDLGIVEHDGSGSASDMTGMSALALKSGSGSVFSVQAMNGRSYIYGGSVTNAYGAFFGAANAGGNITNNYGVWIDSAINTGAVANNYGLYINDQNFVTASQTYNIYSAGSNSRNAFMGFVGIGTAAPNARLHLTAGTASYAPLKLTSGTLLTTPASGAIEYDGFNLYYTDGSNTRRTIATGSGVTSAAIVSALGYTPANSATVATLSSTVTSLAATVSGVVSSQWATSGTAINYLSGNVGVGLTNPAQALDVSGTVKATKFYAGDGAFNNPSIAFTNSSNTGFYNAGGSLGISVGGGLKGTWSSGSLSFNAGGAGPQIYFTGGNAAQPSYAFNVDSDTGMFNPNSSGGSNELGFSTSGTEKVRITSAGSVGIGTTTPDSALTINSNNTKTTLHLTAMGGGGYLSARGNTSQLDVFGGYEYDLAAANYKARATAAAGVEFNAGTFRAYTNSGLTSGNTFTPTERLRIDTSGNVGIGTTGPTAKLHVRQLASESPFSVDKADGTNVMNVDWAGRITMDTNVNSTVPMLTVGNGNFGGRLLVLNGKSGNTSNLLEAKHNSADKFVVTYTGATGIGTSAPTTALHIVTSGAGTARGLRINSTGTGNSIFAEAQFATDAREFRIGVGGASETTYNVPGKFYLFDNNANAMRMVVDSSGHVGVGTTTPAYKFSLYEGAGNVITNVESGNNGSAAYTRTTGKTSGGVTRTMGSGLNISDSNGNFELYDFTAGASRLYVNAAGNVGVGTTAPSNILSVGSDLGSMVNSSGTITLGSANTNTLFTLGQDATNRGRIRWNYNSTPANAFMSVGSNVGQALVLQDNGGNVGIGTTSPTNTLSIVGSEKQIYIRDSDDPTGVWAIGTIGADNKNLNFIDDNANVRMTLTEAGALGVGTSSPTYRLDVAGDIRITGTPYRNGGDSAWIVPSDARLKDVVSTYDRGLREIANIDTIIFNYKKDNPKQIDSSVKYTGVLAQQVQQQIPEAVKVEKDGFLSLNTTPIFWAMINAIKELYHDVLGIKAENAQLKAQSIEQARKIQSLESENAAVKARLERIEKALEKTK